MLFWILLALAILIPLYFGITEALPGRYYRGWSIRDGLGLWFFSSLACFFGAALIFGLTCIVLWGLNLPGATTESRSSTSQLRALNTGDSIEGHFFLGSGHIEGKRVFSYVYEDDGWVRISQKDADTSRVAEDADPNTAHLTTTVFDYTIWWLAPWPIHTQWQHDFHVPAGSVIESYEISAK